MNGQRTIDDVPVAHTPDGGWTTWPPPVLAGCTEPAPVDAPDLDGYWRTVEILVDDQEQPDHPGLGHVQRVEQRGDRLVVTGGGIIHDMRCDGTLERVVHDVAAVDKSTEIHVGASYEDGEHVLRPKGMPIEIRRRREGEKMVWDYLGYTARLEHLAPSETDPANVSALQPIAGDR